MDGVLYAEGEAEGFKEPNGVYFGSTLCALVAPGLESMFGVNFFFPEEKGVKPKMPLEVSLEDVEVSPIPNGVPMAEG